MQGGDWNYVELRLQNTKIDQLGYLQISSVAANSLSLKVQPKK
jgi:hypothetical protein